MNKQQVIYYIQWHTTLIIWIRSKLAQLNLDIRLKQTYVRYVTMGVNEEEGGFGGIKTPRVVLIVLMVFSGLVMVGSGIAHGPWFKCNDVIRYGVWRWCASYIYFRYVAPNDRQAETYKCLYKSSKGQVHKTSAAFNCSLRRQSWFNIPFQHHIWQK